MADAPMDMAFGYGRELSDACPTKICEVGGRGFLALPWGGDDEQQWHPVLRTVLYLIALVWFFLGVALIADVFMGAIEHITSQKKREWSAEKKRHITTLVWNPTVANLTLMALGSSAPEILLSVIELLGNGIYAGDLGPSTIVGSAAFNLFVIIAVCVMAIPDGDLRRIKEMPVYFVTAVWSLFAYLWLLVILQGISPNVVEIWEGLFTFLFFPILVIMAFMADKGYFPGGEEKEEDEDPLADVSRHMTKEELAQVEARVRRSYGEELSESQIAKIISVEHNPNSRAHHRVAAIRALTGGKRVRVTRSTRSSYVQSVKDRLSTRMSRRSSRVAPSEASVVGKTSDESVLSKPSPSDSVTLEFGAPQFAVVENAGKREVPVVRKGNLEGIVRVRYCTREGTAKAGEDYEHSEGVLEFAPGVREVKLSVKIVDDTAFENDEEFFIDLSEPSSDKEGVTVQVGELATATVVIIDDDLPGQISFAFPEDSITVQESGGDRMVDVTVQRKHGCTGNVTCKYYTEDDTAKAGLDYEAMEGVLTFDEGQTAATLKCTIRGSGRYDRKEMFRVILEEPTGGATFDSKTDGGADSCVLTVFIEGEGPVAKARVDRIMHTLTRKWEKSSIGHSNWKDQFLDALYVNGKPDDPQEELLECPASPGSAGGSIGVGSAASVNSVDEGEPSCQDYAMHIITLPWKVLFAFVPPTDYCGGWCCFCCSLGMIALVTALIGDMAALLGCVMGIPDEITAITFVALGTSLPDTFASKTAAMQDPTADASIGNVTGSNSVNVFLGLGLPWTIGSLYWTLGGADAKWTGKFGLDTEIDASFRDGAFVVKAGTLGFSVATFSCCAMAAMIMLYVRRRTVGGELGGPRVNKLVTASFLVMLWVIYVVLSSWYALKERTCP